MSSFIQDISVFTKDFKNHKTYFEPLISGKIIFLNHLNMFGDLLAMFILVCAWFVGSLLFLIFSSGKMFMS